MTWIAVELTLKVHGASDQCRLWFCTDYYSNCEDLHRPATTYVFYLQHARFVWLHKKCIFTVTSQCGHGCLPHVKVELNVTLVCKMALSVGCLLDYKGILICAWLSTQPNISIWRRCIFNLCHWLRWRRDSNIYIINN
jgi:hypothetical protein